MARFLLALVVICTAGCRGTEWISSLNPGASAVRHELELRYEENRRALLARDFNAIMALRTDDFQAVTPDGATHGRKEMEKSISALLEGIDRWNSLSFEILSVTVEGDLASADVRQHVDRMALRNDNKVHRVETWVTQRETWRKTAAGWKLYKVEGIRDQKRVIDGQPG